jgi:hypothetical protein
LLLVHQNLLTKRDPPLTRNGMKNMSKTKLIIGDGFNLANVGFPFDGLHLDLLTCGQLP